MAPEADAAVGLYQRLLGDAADQLAPVVRAVHVDARPAYGLGSPEVSRAWRARMPAQGGGMLTELRLHAARDAVYTVIFTSMPWVAWHGWWALAIAGLFATEIVITMSDFVVEDRVRKPLGGVYPREPVTHGIMAVVYGAVLARLVAVLQDWWDQPSRLRAVAPDVPLALRVGLTAMGIGIALSGLRDIYAAQGGRHGAWPWPAAPA